MISDIDERPASYLRTVLESVNVLEFVAPTTNAQQQSQPQPTEAQLDAYRMDVVKAIRQGDLPRLYEIRDEIDENGNRRTFDACNRNGETLLHLACRCADLAIVQFLVDEGEIPLTSTDLMGRTIIHEVCWRTKPNIELLEFFLPRIDSRMMLQPDIRGHTCFDYCRKEHWAIWKTFIHEHADLIRSQAILYDSTTDSTDATCPDENYDAWLQSFNNYTMDDEAT